MTSFVPKKITSQESLGQKLKERRLSRELSLNDVAKKIGIRAEYLSALEEERWNDLPAGLYGKNFLKEYAALLRVGLAEHHDLLKTIWPARQENPFSQKIVAPKKFIIFPRIVRNILISLALLACLLYLVFYLRKIFWEPRLEIAVPAANQAWDGNNLTVSGRTEKEAEVKINGEIVLNNQNGSFSQAINLKQGLNTITISAKKKHSREKTIIRQILAP